ncbi:MAG TPA: hypothetical protein DC452_04605 [Roseburia sp.]|nr:hypothetical protein [Roseburia sp.]
MDFVVLKSYVSPFLMLISVFAFIWQTYIIIAFFLFFFNEAGQQENKMEIFVFLKLLCVMNGLIDRNKKGGK